MAKSKGRSTQKTTARRATAARTRIVQLDRQLIRLVHKRAENVLAAAQATSDGQLSTLPAIEELLATENHGPLPPSAMRAVLSEVASGCQALVRETRVAYFGPPLSLGHLAATHCFGQGVELAPVGAVAAVFEEIRGRQSDYGLVMLENLSECRLADTLEMLVQSETKICGEVALRVHYALLGKCHRAEVREVYGRPESLACCRAWTAKHLPSARMVEVTSTTTAAQLAREKPGATAVASLQAGRQYELDVLAENIEDPPPHCVRFAVIGRESVPRTGRDRTAIVFQVPHRSGALADVMGVFKRNKLNVTRIESLGLDDTERTCLLFAETDGHQSDTKLRRAMMALRRKTSRLDLLGSFPAAMPVE